MNTIELIRDNLERSRDLVLVRIEDMEDHALVAPTPRGGCHTLWVLGHLAYIETLVVRHFMLGEPNPLAAWEQAFDGAEVSYDPADYPSFAEALAGARDARRGTLELLEQMEESDLNAPGRSVPEGVEALFGTRRKCFQYAADHWLMHRGQLADARRAAGLERMWY